MLGLHEKLKNRTHPIRIGLVGAGYMGSGIFNIINQVENMEVVALYDEDEEIAKSIKNEYGKPSLILSEEVSDLCSVPEVEVVVDGTCSPELGASVGYYASQEGKHLVSINIEADVTIGALLRKLFEEKGNIYTVTAGDEPGELKRLYDHYSTLNFRIVACGKGKNNPLNVEATPETVKKTLPENGITAEQVTSFVDGSKTMFEMACLSNATGLEPDVRGMHGVEARIPDLTKLFRSKEKGGILNKEGVVDYVTGQELSGGVFIVVCTDNERIQSDLAYLRIGQGPYYLSYQRHHNWFIDLPLSIAKVVLQHEPVIMPLEEPTSEVIAVSKKDLKKGDTLDGIGGFTVYGIIEKAEIAKKQNALQLGLCKGAVMENDIPKGQVITCTDVELNEDSILAQLRRKQDATTH